MLFLWPLLIYSEWWYALYSSVKPAYICGWCTHTVVVVTVVMGCCDDASNGHEVCLCARRGAKNTLQRIHPPSLSKSFQRICIMYDVFYLLFTLPVSMRLFIFIVVKSIFFPRTFFYSYIIFIFFICSFFVALLLIRCLVCWGIFFVTFSLVSLSLGFCLAPSSLIRFFMH